MVASEREILAPLSAALADLISWLRTEQVRGIVIGGVAVSLLGRPRFTNDVDAVVIVDQERWQHFLESAVPFGFKPRRPGPLAFARRNRMLLLRHEPSGVEVDISLGFLPFEHETIARSRLVDIEELSVPVPSVEDLIIMKAVAHRPLDMGDIEALLDVHPKLDLTRVRRWVRDFSDVMEMPDILEDLEKLLERQRASRETSPKRRRKAKF